MKSKKYLFPSKAILLLAIVIAFAALSGGLLLFAAGEEPPEVDFGQAAILEELLPLPEAADLNNVYLINCDVLEIEYNEPVTAAQAKALFTIKVDGVEVEWEFLSYFDFGPYAARGGVVNVRLTEPLDTGNPRGRIRASEQNEFLRNTQLTLGPAAAAKITVTAGAATKTAAWKAFYTERSLGYMSRVYAYAAAEAGNNGQQIRDYGTNYSTGNVFSATAEPKYTDEFIARQVAEGMHRFCGRSEFLTLPFVDSGFKALLVGASQSVYEAPEFRELYEFGVTTDTYTRTSINPTAVPGNFLGNGKYKKPFVVGTADDVMRHYSPLKADGTPATGNADSARPRSDYFHFAEAFFDIYYEIGVKVGCPRFPLGPDNDPNDYRFDLQLIKYYNNAKAAGQWPGTAMMNSVKEYYLYGAMIHWEFIPETQEFKEKSFPVNTRAEMYEYDYDLYWAMCGIFGKYEYWTGVSTLQGASTIDDSSKWCIPWFWHNQPDNFGLPATIDGTVGVPYPPLAIKSADIIAHNRIRVYFNREVRTVQTVTTGGNWTIYIGDRQLPASAVSEGSGYNWKCVTLQTNCTVNFTTGAVTNADNRLDNGKPYGRYFAGFSQADIDERKISSGGWIANNTTPGVNALEFGQFVSLQDAIDTYGAGPRDAKIEVAYIGSADVTDWGGNILPKNVKHQVDKFEPWIGHAYRSPLTGFYTYLDTAVWNRYDVKTVAVAGALLWESHMQNNKTVTYPKSAGGDDFPASANQAWNVPVFYDRVGQRIADGAIGGTPGGMLVAAGSNLGNHPGMQGGNLRGTGVGDSYRVEGWGGNTFQAEDVLIMRDYNLCRYRNEALVLHEGGHGIDSFAPAYAQNIYNDISAAHATATAAVNGARWRDVDNVVAYCGSRGEYTSTLPTFYAGVMREQMMGVNDGTWTPMCVRSELFLYDPYGFEVFKRIFYTGELHLWYENKIGDPAYRVMPEDWELLRDTYPEFSHWKSVDDLIAWGYSIPQVQRHNPYTEALNNLPYKSQSNDAVRWVSWNVPNVWQPEPYKAPTNPAYPNNRFDFVGGSSYFPIPDFDDPDGLEPLKNQEHPFARPGGVPKPERPAELEALAKPVYGTITNHTATRLPRPVLVQFGFENYSGAITSNNALSSFLLKVNGKYSHFYLWEFKETAPGTATVTLRLDWPLEPGDVVTVSQPVVIEVADVWTAPGGSVDVTYSIKGNALGFTTFDFELPFNERFAATKVTPAAKVTAAGMYFISNITADAVKIAFASTENVSGDGLLFTVTYQVPASVAPIFDEVLDVKVNAIKLETNKDEIIDLGYSVKPGALVIGLMGDVDGNGLITPEDAITLLQMYVGLIPWTPRALLLGDINKDGVVDPTDAALILRMVVGG